MITAKIVQNSIHKGIRIITFELEYPRFIHSEFMTHRMFSRNSASSRAIPVEKMLENIQANPEKPIHWGKNVPGMQAPEEVTGNELVQAKSIWERAADKAVHYAIELKVLGVHKQVTNRLTEPFQRMKTVVTATEWDNWYELRNHKDAQPEIHELARQMLVAQNNSIPLEIGQGEWHVPYVERHWNNKDKHLYYMVGKEYLDAKAAKMISASCCAQVSYRKSDDSLEKAILIYDKLISMRPKHSSPFEHQATPIFSYYDTGVTHRDVKGDVWSGNFRGWLQHRQLI